MEANSAMHGEIHFAELRGTQPARVLRIQTSKGWVPLRVRELWEYRELIYFLVWGNVKIRYKQTVLGAAWAIIQPLMTMLVFSLFFGKLAKIPSDNVPYPIFSFAALVPWTFFSNSLRLASDSLIGSAHLITKVYFPRLAIPIATVLSGVVDFAIAFLMLVVMMLYYGIVPGNRMLWLPLFFLLALVASLGTSLWLSALSVEYRDVQHVMPFVLQFWLFATPIAYSSTLLSEPWRTLYGLNPMVGVVDGFRWALLGTHTAPGPIVILSSIAALITLISGAFYFRRMERTFADMV
jgi:lipopolysaccharide transport system permease protein